MIKIIRKHSVTFFLITGISLIAASQTYIGPLIGYDFTYVKTSTDRQFEFNDGLFSSIYNINEKVPANSLIFGIQIQQQLSTNFSLSLKGLYTRKILDSYYPGPCPFEKDEQYSFDTYRILVATQWTLLENWHIGGGPIINNFTNNRIVVNASNGWINYKKTFSREYGIHAYLGYSYKNFTLDLNYQHGLFMDYDQIIYFVGLRSINLSVGYLFKVRGKRR